MKNGKKYYVLIWIILLVIFNSIVFLMESVIPGYKIYHDTRFWIAWVAIVFAFLVNLVCASFVFKPGNYTKSFYVVPLVTVSWAALISIVVAGSLLIAIPDCPDWIAGMVCIVISSINAIAVIKTCWAIEETVRIDNKIEVQTSFIKNLTVEAESIMAHAKSDEVKAECKKVYEAIRYSDPVSNSVSVSELSSVEVNIKEKIDELGIKVTSECDEEVQNIVKDILLLLDFRNQIVRRNK